MDQRLHKESDNSAEIPFWRRATAFMTLSSMTILGGMLIAASIALIGILLLYGLEGAAQ